MEMKTVMSKLNARRITSVSFFIVTLVTLEVNDFIEVDKVNEYEEDLASESD